MLEGSWVCRLFTLYIFFSTAVLAAKVVHDGKASAVSKTPLIQNHMVNVVQLVWFGLMTDESFLLLLHLLHKFLLIFLFVI